MSSQLISQTWDIAVIGGGPAGLSAAVNAAVRNKKVLVIEPQELCRKVGWAEKVNNYLGLPKISGRDLAAAYIEHFRSFNVPVLERRAEMVADMGDGFVINVGSGDLKALAVVLALGVTAQKSLPGEEEFVGRGVSYCATCDGPLYRGRDVAVLAFSPEAVEEANFLAEICRRVYLVKAVEKIEGLSPDVTVIEGKPQAVGGEDFVGFVTVDDREIAVEGVFVIRATLPARRLIFGLEMTEGFVGVDRQMATSVKGVWAAGDCTGKPHQMSRAVGEGATAALNAVRYLDDRSSKG